MGDRQTDVARRHAANRRGDELLFNRAVGANLRERRLEAGITQDQLATQAGLTRTSVANIERGEQMPGLYRLVLMSATLGCPLHDLLPEPDSFTAERVATAIGDEYASAVIQIREMAQRRRSGSVT